MSSPRSIAPGRLPGNDGTWYLRAAGVDRTPTGLGDVDGTSDSTSELVRELWETGSGDEFASWAPNELSRAVERRRRFRWTTVALVVVLFAAVVVVGLWLPASSARRADARAAEYGEALAVLLGDMPPAQQMLAELTEPDIDASQLADRIPTLAGLGADADEAIQLAGEPLPGAYPLASTTPFEELAPTRSSLSMHATTAAGVVRRLTDLLEYRTALASFLDVGILPRSSSGADLSELSTRLATASADTAGLLSELPDDAALAAHKAAAQSVAERFATWQVDYVDALRNGNEVSVGTLLDELADARRELDGLMLEALGRIRTVVDQEILDLAAALEASINDLTG